MASIEINKLNKLFGSVQVLFDIDISIGDGEFVVLVGPSGCGKTTLLRMIAGLEPISAGEIAIDGKVVNSLPPKDRDVAMVFQNYALYPHLTVFGNMAFSLRMRRAEKTTIGERVKKVAETLGLSDYLDRYPRQLSGGQRQRVAMGRAIVRDPLLFLFDEPLSNLDAKLRLQMRTEIKGLHQRLKTTSVYVTHDQVEAMTMADRIVVLNEGRVVQYGAPLEVYDRPSDTFVAGFIGSPSMNFIEGIVRRRDDGVLLETTDSTPLPLPGDTRAEEGTEVIYGIRPKHLALTGEGQGVESRVSVVEPTGSDTLVFCTLAGTEICVELPERHDIAPGQHIHLIPRIDRVHLFDYGSGRRL